MSIWTNAKGLAVVRAWRRSRGGVSGSVGGGGAGLEDHQSLIAPFGRNEGVIVVVTRDHVAGDARIGERSGNGRCQADTVERRMNLKRNLRHLQPAGGKFCRHDQGQAFGFPDGGNGLGPQLGIVGGDEDPGPGPPHGRHARDHVVGVADRAGRSAHRTLSVASPIIARIREMIQNRMTIWLSDQPSFS